MISDGRSVAEREREDWALDDRAAKALIGGMLALQVFVLLGAVLWL